MYSHERFNGKKEMFFHTDKMKRITISSQDRYDEKNTISSQDRYNEMKSNVF